MENEIWKGIEGYEDYYEVSDLGRVKSCSRNWVVSENGRRSTFKEKIRKLKDTHKNSHATYLEIGLTLDGTVRLFGVARLVLQAFDRYPVDNEVACHIDGDARNNCISNLKWVKNGYYKNK